MKEELSSEKMAEETKEAVDVSQWLTPTDSNEEGALLMTPSNDLKIPVITSVYDEETNLVVQVTEDREDDTVILTSSNELVWTPERDSVQLPEELERTNSIKHIALPTEGTSFMQLRIPLVIPVVNALTTQKAQTCNNCDERVVAIQTFCYPEWCENCDEALWSTREIHS